MAHITALPEKTRIEEYEIRQVLGQGGFGITYLAEDIHLGKRVAVKEYLPRDFATRGVGSTVTPISSAEAADYRWGLDRFLDEGRALARFEHPHLNKVHRFFKANETAYLVLEYIEGETLSAVLQREGRLSQAQVKRLLGEVLSGLEEVHGAGYVHRDLTPSNLMLRREDGSVVVLDFGTARQVVGQRSKSLTSILTAGYAPIEQYAAKAGKVGPWSDLYALGMVAYRCVSGLGDGELPDAVTRSRAARRGSGELEPAASIGQGRYDGRLLRAIDWAIQVEEEDRPQSIGEWRRALPPLDAQEQPAPARSSPPSVPAPERSIADAERPAPSLLRWAATAAGAALVVTLVGGAYWLGQQTSQPSSGSAEGVTSTSTVEPQPGEVFHDCPTCPELVVVPAGSYQMGSPAHEVARHDDEGPVHRVRIANPFAVGVYEVTVGEYGRFVETTSYEGEEECYMYTGVNFEKVSWRDPGFRQTERDPVVCVSWEDAQAYAAWLSEETGQGYRLLSEAEWEYVARAGTTTPFHFGETISPSQANYDGGYYDESDDDYYYGGGYRSGYGPGQHGEQTMPVGSFEANAFGLYDVHGNVWEWVQDCWHENYNGAPSDGRAWETGDCRRRVWRGGSWEDGPWMLRSAKRFSSRVKLRDFIGFRIARSLP